MKKLGIVALVLMLALAMLVPTYVFAEGESVDTPSDLSSTDPTPVTPSGFKMSYGYRKLQSYDGATPAEYVKGQTPATAYVEGGGSYKVSANYYTYNDYVFAGWSCGGKIYQPGEVIYNVRSDMTFIATWARGARPDMVVYGILSYSEGGKVTDSLSVAVGSTVKLKEGTWLDSFGRVFKGGSAFLLSATEAELSAGTEPSDTVSVKYSGASAGTQSAFKIAKNGCFAVDGCYEKRSGFTFTGWQCGDKVYLPGDTCVASESITFTAIWREASKPAPNYCTVNVTVGEGGTATPGGKSTVVKGEKFTFTVEADDYYALESVVCGGNELGTGGSYTVTVNSNLDIKVSFKKLDKPAEPKPESKDEAESKEPSVDEETSDVSTDNNGGTNEGGNGISRKAMALIAAGLMCVAVLIAAFAYYVTGKKSKPGSRRK